MLVCWYAVRGIIDVNMQEAVNKIVGFFSYLSFQSFSVLTVFEIFSWPSFLKS